MSRSSGPARPPTRLQRTRVLMPVIGLALAAIGAATGEILRHELIEPVERAAACLDAPATWWCPLRDGLRVAAQNYVIAGLAIALALASLVLRRGGATSCALGALFLGGAALYLYSAGLGAIAVVLALVRAAGLER